jgi:hypothetical protein
VVFEAWKSLQSLKGTELPDIYKPMHRIKGLLIPWDPDGHIIKNPHHN